ncbi:Protein GPR108 [Dichanthelium oligosanthes]|uniref:Protein GPR108 n=1 Tax=Dichanthelium oligosanthes TaxID=888268 RepID=A0A1E5VTQ3_9POAL|nr:Protein GPR108 [Dichanthelium oligosanthes]
MGTSVAVAAAVATAVLLLVRVARAEIKTMPIVSDPRSIILFEQFGFASGGKAAISISRASWQLRPGSRLASVDPNLMGFVLISGAQFPKVNNQSEYAATDPSGGRFCVLTSDYALPVIRLNDVPPGGVTTTVTIDDPDEYAVVFSNCLDGVEVTMDVRTEMYNVVRRDASGGIRDYLPVGLQPLPAIYAGVSAVYLAFLAGWAWTCARQRATAERIHAVMGALLLFKALKTACAAEDAWFVERTGTPHGWDVAFYIFGFFKGILLFTVIVLIGTGWSFLKPYLQEREKSVLMIVIPLQVIENLVLVVIGETGPTGRDWIVWNQVFLLIDVICCCAVFFPIIWSIRGLREASKTDGKAARNLQKLTLFKRFYLVVVGYLYFTRIIVSAFLAVLNYRYQWGVNVAVEGASFAFYLFVFYNFKPVEKNPYLYIGDEEEEVAGGELEMDDGAF